jgi:hypothetical protein
VCCLILIVDYRIFVGELDNCLQLLPHDVHVGCKVLFPEHPEASHPLHPNTPEGTPEDSPRPGEIPLVPLSHVDISDVPEVFSPPPRGERTDSLENPSIHNTEEDYHIRRGERPAGRFHLSRDDLPPPESAAGPFLVRRFPSSFVW